MDIGQWTVLLPIAIKPKIVKEALQWRSERQRNVTSVKPNWQAIWTYSVITSLLLNGTVVRITSDLEKTANMNWLPFLLSVITSVDAFLYKGSSGTRRTILFILFMTQYTKRTRIHKRVPSTSAHISPKGQFHTEKWPKKIQKSDPKRCVPIFCSIKNPFFNECLFCCMTW